MFAIDQHMWRVSGRRGGLGLSCTEDGLLLGNTPLLERCESGFIPRPREELETLLSRGFGFAVSLDRVMGGLGAVASALNASNLCRARIAAVHLRLPDLPDAFAGLDMQLEDVALKLDHIAKTTAAGDWNPAGGGWDPNKHPRRGTTPNPGWFAPTSGSEDNGVRPTLISDNPDDDGRVHLPPGQRIDELGDLLEWVANAKPEDADAIRAEIKRVYFDVGDTQGAAALNNALTDVLDGQDTATRQWVLDNFEKYTRTDPSEIGRLKRDLVGGILLNPLVGEAAEVAPSVEAEVAPATQQASNVWGLGWAARGQAIEKAIKPTLPEGAVLADNFPVIDHATGDIITSIKSIDLNAATYQQPEILARRIDQYAEAVAGFATKRWGNATVAVTENTQRQLIIAVPKGSISRMQQEVIDTAVMRAQNRVQIRIAPF